MYMHTPGKTVGKDRTGDRHPFGDAGDHYEKRQDLPGAGVRLQGGGKDPVHPQVWGTFGGGVPGGRNLGEGLRTGGALRAAGIKDGRGGRPFWDGCCVFGGALL